jgi:hypothetical protein
VSVLSRLLEKLDRKHDAQPVPESQPETGPGYRRRLPGMASRNAAGEVDFRSGVVTYASERIIYIEQKHPEHKLVFACGQNYFYWCNSCECTVYEEELLKFDSFALTELGILKCCPHPGTERRPCAVWGPDGKLVSGTELTPIKVGDKVRTHYRYMVDAHGIPTSGNWWAERWDG